MVETVLKELHTYDHLPVQLGNLASSTNRLAFLIRSNKPEKTIHLLLQECQSFAQWTFPQANFETQLALSNLQADLSVWKNDFENQKNNSDWRAEVNAACEKWSQRLLKLSGLLRTGIPK